MGTRRRNKPDGTSDREGLEGMELAIVGPGRVGQALGKVLAGAGINIRYVAARRPEAARRAVRFIGSGTAIGLNCQSLAGVDVIVLTVSDVALAPLARQLANWSCPWSARVVLHTCGALPSTVLRPLRQRGVAIGSLHPFQTIPSPAIGFRSLPGSFWAIEGDALASRVAVQLVRALDGLPFRVRPIWKILYHGAAFLACPGVVALLDQSARILRSAGVPARIVRPMLGEFVADTVKNFVSLGGRRALTGPAVRGDWPTIEGHLRALRRYAPRTLPVYRELLRAIVRLAGRKLPRRLLR